MEKWQDPQVIALWIAIVVVLVFTILLFVVKIMHTGYKRMAEANLREAQLQLEHQKKLMETGLIAQEKERERIAADLHDGLIGKLSVIRMKSQMGHNPSEIDSLLEDGISEARRISHDLTPPLLEHTAIDELIAGLLEPWKHKFNILFYKDMRHVAPLPADVKLQLLRVVQELLTNTIKHTEASKITVQLRYTEGLLILRMADNGKGFDTTMLKKGLGLNSLELRMQYLNAAYKITSVAGKGTGTIIAVHL